MEPWSRPNEDQAQYWNGPEADHWLAHEHRYERVLAPFAAIESVAEPLLLGCDVADTVEFFKATGIGQTLLQGVDAVTVSRVTEAVQAALEPHLTSDGVRLASRAWLVTARSPR